MVQYFREEVSKKQKFSDEEIDTVLNELDPFFTGVIQLKVLSTYFQEEIHYYSQTSMNLPQQIL